MFFIELSILNVQCVMEVFHEVSASYCSMTGFQTSYNVTKSFFLYVHILKVSRWKLSLLQMNVKQLSRVKSSAHHSAQ